MSHSDFPWSQHPQSRTAVYDAHGDKIAATLQGHNFKPIDIETAADNAALIAAIPAMVEALEHVTELLVDTWANAMDGDPEREIAVADARAVLASIGKKP